MDKPRSRGGPPDRGRAGDGSPQGRGGQRRGMQSDPGGRAADRPQRAGDGGPRAGRSVGASGPAAAERGGARLAARSVRLPEPAIPEGVTGFELDRSVHAQLRTLSKENAQGVAQHLVMVATLLDEDLAGASAHAETAVRRAGRVPAVREAMGLVAYRMGDWSKALSEFRTARRLSGSSHMLPFMVDAERGLGRLERALDLAASPEAASLPAQERVELAIVVSGIRRDLGQPEAAALSLRIPELQASAGRPWTARLCYAYAETQLAIGDAASARVWFSRAVDADHDGETDAADRLAKVDGVELTDLMDSEPD
jgi:tetratricopeptide (TPR) repeat protein